MKLSKKVSTAAIAMAAAAVVIGVASPALAASSTCYTDSFWDITKTCNTAAVKSNAAHDIRVRISACKGSPWKVWDINTGKTVASGTGKGQGTEINKVINGLYGTYKARLSDGCLNDWVALQDY
jgi:hypothetical protein